MHTKTFMPDLKIATQSWAQEHPHWELPEAHAQSGWSYPGSTELTSKLSTRTSPLGVTRGTCSKRMILSWVYRTYLKVELLDKNIIIGSYQRHMLKPDDLILGLQNLPQSWAPWQEHHHWELPEAHAQTGWSYPGSTELTSKLSSLTRTSPLGVTRGTCSKRMILSWVYRTYLKVELLDKNITIGSYQRHMLKADDLILGLQNLPQSWAPWQEHHHWELPEAHAQSGWSYPGSWLGHFQASERSSLWNKNKWQNVTTIK